MTRRTNESARLWFLVALFFIMVGLIGWSFSRAVNDINAQTVSILEEDFPRAKK